MKLLEIMFYNNDSVRKNKEFLGKIQGDEINCYINTNNLL